MGNQFIKISSTTEFNEARFEAIAQTASDSIVIADENSTIVFANKKTYELFGHAEASLAGASLSILMPETYKKGHSAWVQRYVATGAPVLMGRTIEIEGVRKDGSVFPLELSLSSWKEADTYFFSAIIRDISERTQILREKEEANTRLREQQKELEAANEKLKAAEEALRRVNNELEQRVELRTRELYESQHDLKRSEQWFRLITDTMPVLISYKDRDYIYRFINKAYEDFRHEPRENVIGKHVWDVIGQDAFKTIQPLFERVFRGEIIDAEIVELDVKEVGKGWWRFSMIPHMVNGEVVGVFHLTEDITEYKKTQLELELKNTDLQRSNNDLNSFVYTVSHDLKTPITNIEGLLSLLKGMLSGKVEPKESKLLDMMDTSVQKLQTTIGDLLKIIRTQKEFDEVVEESIRFDEICREVQEDVFTLISESNATITENFEETCVEYKRSSLRSILYNLLSNAIKYRSPERPLEVQLKTYCKDGWTILSVKDNGLGLSPKQQKKAFTLFNRMHKHIEGTGIGLFMINRIAENNGGKIEMESEEGKGTTFYVYLKRYVLPGK
ncbi:PAS domain S-box protein [Cesiribacter sp. SM1]|uniref:PAS domain S-box protein n=1 Tax=Cesiribacter sp. SM1 TaxID=2861196 RepID=UPI001CD1FEA4|nr:PAS domain S-box protein [Cesiribacter sp. SM1]